MAGVNGLTIDERAIRAACNAVHSRFPCQHPFCSCYVIPTLVKRPGVWQRELAEAEARVVTPGAAEKIRSPPE
jgi:hypothetical protein